ncbi:MAG: site-specific DNA-methyltransferase [Sphingomonas sp.]|uniref:DNA methyltransferase n=1 Tax=Sphingomonas sp. TaxID=28214 RepID=UPI0025CDA6E9|nr:DNA methyltransferase [Sphingomonas sp.]MBX9881933.1 site-specific DNA-methyltransferase [Sphingomonas sp.]
MRNELYYGDNLDVLRRKIGTESVDLCYIDPPFNSKRNYFQIYNNQGSEDRAQAQAFVDTWNWGDEAAEGLDYILDIERLNPRPGETRWTEQTVELIGGLEKVLGRGSLLAYLVHMTLRIVEIHRVLKPTGSFYLHCDPTASHYLKLVLDAVFCGQGGLFRNEIIWKRTTAHSDAGEMGNVHDTLLFYSKGLAATWNKQFQPYDETYIDSHYRRKTDDGRRYRLSDTTAYGLSGGGYTYEWRGVTKLWRYPIEKMQEHHDNGRLRYTKNGTPEYIRYLDEMPGMPLQDVWNDIFPINPRAQERLGYPTQKPEALLERIIRASSNEGDTVLDAYCGCGTTVAVAQRLGRRWIGIDITYQSISLILKRLQDRYPDDWPAIEAAIKLDGVPRDLESAMALANRRDDKTRKEFEKWAVLTFSNNQARINEKKGADGGIDGIAYFLIDKETNGKAIFQVKSRPGTRGDLATLNSDRLREKAEFGFLICTALPTKPMRDEIAAAGKYKHPLLDREDDRLQVITVAELFDYPNKPARRLDLPMARKDAVKSAAAKGDEDRQMGLL